MESTPQVSAQLLLDEVAAIAVAAGDAILQVYSAEGDVEVAYKADDSPLTAADRRAHELIDSRLRALTPHLPVLSEESKLAPYSTRKTWQTYWLVDPLDGTKEFVKRNGEFTVNIALIENGQAVLGVVHVPVLGTTYSGSLPAGATITGPNGKRQSIRASAMDSSLSSLRLVASRSHRDQRLETLINKLRDGFARVEEVSMGSSLKICLLAEGKADLYPRTAPTCEWDTAAAHAVLSAAGGELVDMQFAPLRYNQKEDMLNPSFIAMADPNYDWSSLLS